MQFKKNLLVVVSALFFVWFISGCGESGNVTVNGTGVSSGTTSGSSTTLAKNGLSGTVANGVAVANAKVTLETAKGDTKVVGTTDAKGQY